ncbi:MAG: T9SS type A sorting domain-containing protein [Bacteroidetes bacterium]|nr:T9SS type A sorting domain-containing protein [Bacteroidota bacterium]
MKTKLFITLFAIVNAFVNAQQYPPMLKNTEWFMKTSCPWVGNSSKWYNLINDSIINGITYKQYSPSNGGYLSFVREDTLQKKVWININSQDKLLYDFNLTVGDTFTTATYQNVKFVLVLQDSVSTCAGQRKRMKFNPVPGQSSQPVDFECIEGVGSLFDPFALFYRANPPDQCGSLLICCHQNNIVNYVDTDPDSVIICPENCLPILKINENTDLNISMHSKIYPNPFSNKSTMQTDNFLKCATLTFYSSFGQPVKQIKNISEQTVTLHRDNLPSGLYFIRLTQDNKVIAADKLVITDN